MSATANQPEHKISLPGSVSVAIWRNEATGDDGTREFRSVTISPRRFKDPATGEWRDSPSFRPSDIPCLVSVLEAALEWILTREQGGS